jgi:hypothetical protein
VRITQSRLSVCAIAEVCGTIYGADVRVLGYAGVSTKGGAICAATMATWPCCLVARASCTMPRARSRCSLDEARPSLHKSMAADVQSRRPMSLAGHRAAPVSAGRGGGRWRRRHGQRGCISLALLHCWAQMSLGSCITAGRQPERHTLVPLCAGALEGVSAAFGFHVMPQIFAGRSKGYWVALWWTCSAAPEGPL